MQRKEAENFRDETGNESNDDASGKTKRGFSSNHAWFCIKPRLVLVQTMHGFTSNHAWF
jgi:hypothetical protein